MVPPHNSLLLFSEMGILIEEFMFFCARNLSTDLKITLAKAQSWVTPNSLMFADEVELISYCLKHI